MQLWDIIGRVGSTALQVAFPGTGSVIVGAINAMLPEDKRLPEGATGADVADAVKQLPPGKQAELLGREFDVHIAQIEESNATVRAMLEADTKTPHTTRPYIAKGSFHVVAAVTLITISLWAYGVGTNDAALVTAIMDGWPFILSVIGPLVTLLRAYFGVLKQEQRNRFDAANGVPASGGIAGAMAALLGRR